MLLISISSAYSSETSTPSYPTTSHLEKGMKIKQRPSSFQKVLILFFLWFYLSPSSRTVYNLKSVHKKSFLHIFSSFATTKLRYRIFNLLVVAKGNFYEWQQNFFHLWSSFFPNFVNCSYLWQCEEVSANYDTTGKKHLVQRDHLSLGRLIECTFISLVPLDHLGRWLTLKYPACLVEISRCCRSTVKV